MSVSGLRVRECQSVLGVSVSVVHVCATHCQCQSVRPEVIPAVDKTDIKIQALINQPVLKKITTTTTHTHTHTHVFIDRHIHRQTLFTDTEIETDTNSQTNIHIHIHTDINIHTHRRTSRYRSFCFLPTELNNSGFSQCMGLSFLHPRYPAVWIK